jgi:hypothetical protein
MDLEIGSSVDTEADSNSAGSDDPSRATASMPCMGILSGRDPGRRAPRRRRQKFCRQRRAAAQPRGAAPRSGSPSALRGQVAFYVISPLVRAWHSTRTRVRALTIFLFGVGLGVIAGHYHHPLRRAGTAHQRPRRLRFHPCTETLPQEQQTQILTTTTGGL